ncbi:MAG: hypothetical protein ACRCU2_12405, partial [Planktothrix sp.]
MNYLIYPRLDLFLYDVRDGLGESSTEVSKNQKIFKEKLKNFNSSDLIFENTTSNSMGAFFTDEEEVEYMNILPPKEENTFTAKYDSEFIKKADLEGYYYPVGLNDAYGLLIDCSIKHQEGDSGHPEIPHCPINCFVELKNYIDEKRNYNSASLGETWMLSGEISNKFKKDPEELAKECYKALIPEADWNNNFQGKGRLFGGFIFELWGMSSMPLTPPPNRLKMPLMPPANPLGWHHVIITLYPDKNSARKARDFKIINSWMRLFYYRSKIQWCYNQTRRLKGQLKANFVSIYEEITKIKNATVKDRNFIELSKNLDTAQETLSNYSLNLSKFEYQFRTLEVNLYNYQHCLERLEEITGLESNLLRQSNGGYLLRSSKLKFLTTFSQWA